MKPAWYEFTHHEFVRQMGDGSLSPEAFKYYMIQDYLYLVSGVFVEDPGRVLMYSRYTLPGQTHWPATRRSHLTTLRGRVRVTMHKKRLITNESSQAAEIVTHIRQEINLHIRECEDFGLTQELMERYDESQGALYLPDSRI